MMTISIKLKPQNMKNTKKYYNYDITILNFKMISDKNITITIYIIILCSPSSIPNFICKFCNSVHSLMSISRVILHNAEQNFIIQSIWLSNFYGIYVSYAKTAQL